MLDNDESIRGFCFLESRALTYFTPWRRKLGIVTLLLACAFAGLWVRSISLSDQGTLEVRSGRFLPYSYNTMTSQSGCFSWTCRYGGEDQRWLNGRLLRLRIGHPISGIMPNRLIQLRYVDRELRWPAAGFYVGTGKVELGVRLFDMIGVKLPYYSIVVPLTMLSAWLLLSKPKPKSSPTPV